MKPRIWTVLLSWNGKDDTLACLETLQAQTYPPHKIVVVDNGSTDGLEKPLRERFPEADYCYQEKNLGFTGGMNLGIKLALENGADYVFTPNNDTLLDPHCLEILVNALEARPEAGAASPKIFLWEPADYIYFNGGDYSPVLLNPRHPGKNRPDTHPHEREIREILFLNGCAPFYRVKALRETGIYYEKLFFYFEDADLSLRFNRSKWKILLVPEARVIHREGVASQKNAGPKLKGTISPWKWFLLTRNQIWLIRRHGSWMQRLFGIGYFLLRQLGISLFLILRGRTEKSLSIYKGLWQGLTHAVDRI